MTAKMQEVFKLNKATPGKTWFEASMLADGDNLIDIRGIIGDWEVDPILLSDQMASADLDPAVKRHVMRIDSNGGLIGAGVTLMTSISQLTKPVIAEIWGSCYSMATMVAMAADEVRIAKDASMMIHNPRTIAIGTSSEMSAALQYLDNVRAQAIDRYTAKVEAKSHTREEVDAAMTDSGTYYTSLQAIEFGLADVMMEDKRETPRMLIDREYAAVMLADAPAEIEIPLEPEAEAEAAVVEEPTVVVSPVVETPVPVIEDVAPAAEMLATDKAKMQANADPRVAAMKSEGEQPLVSTARKVEAAQDKPVASEPAPWAMRVAEMNRNFGRF